MVLPNAWILAVPLVAPSLYLALRQRAVLRRMSDTAGYSASEKTATALASVVQYPFFLTTLWCPLLGARPVLLAGAAAYLLGTGAYYVAIVQFARTPDQVLQTGGLHRWSRHPMYCSATLALLAICLLTANVVLATWLVAMLCCQHIMIRAEERRCDEKFGAAYAAYCRRVPRYLLWV